MTVIIQLTDSERVFAKKIHQAIINHLNERLPRCLVPVERRLKEEILSIFRVTDTYKALTVGELTGEFGFAGNNGFSKVENVLLSIIQTMKIEFRKISYKNNYYNGGFRITLLPSGLRAVLDTADGAYITEKGQTIPWLNWLLTKGDSIIIIGYEYLPYPGQGRSGEGFMLKGKDNTSLWNVPPEYSGTKDNNWITRTIDADKVRLEQFFAKVFEEEIGKVI